MTVVPATNAKLQSRGGIDFAVADLGLADYGRNEIRLAQHEMPGLMTLRREYGNVLPLRGAQISGSLHMTVRTAVLIETLVSLGAQVRGPRATFSPLRIMRQLRWWARTVVRNGRREYRFLPGRARR